MEGWVYPIPRCPSAPLYLCTVNLSGSACCASGCTAVSAASEALGRRDFQVRLLTDWTLARTPVPRLAHPGVRIRRNLSPWAVPQGCMALLHAVPRRSVPRSSPVQ
jgi:hypothetical protein